MNTTLSYNNSPLVPAPFAGITKRYNSAGDGTKLGVEYNLTLTGKIVAWKGSPNTQGVFGINNADEVIQEPSRLAAISQKQEAIRRLFSTNGLPFFYQAPDGTSSGVLCYPTINSVNFGDGIWTDVSDYTIEMTAPQFISSPFPENDLPFPEFIQTAAETVEFQDSDVPYTYAVTRTTSAQGKLAYSSGILPSSAWQYAKAFVWNRLGLGYSTTTAFSAYPPAILATGSALNGAISLSGLSPYNYKRVENVDEMGGTYNLTETWVLASGNAIDTYTMNFQNSFEGGLATQTIGIQGTVRGLYVNLGDYNTRYVNATGYYYNYVQGQLFNRVSTLASGTTINNFSITLNEDFNPFDGTVSYNSTYDNRILGPSGTREEFTVSKSQTLEDYNIQVRVEGSIYGRSTLDQSLKFATADWVYGNLLSGGTFYARAIQYASLSGLAPIPLEASKDSDVNQGTVRYAQIFSNRICPSAIESFEVQRSFDRQNGVTVVSIQGEVRGLATNQFIAGVSGTDLINTKWANASGFYYNSVLPNIPKRVVAYGATIVNTGSVVNLSEGKNQLAGTISYSYSYDSTPAPLFPGALYESLSITDVGPGQVFASIGVPFRATGPILQDMGTVTSRTRQINYELVMPQPTGGIFADWYAAEPIVTGILNPLFPTNSFAEAPTQTFDPRSGRFAFSQSFVFFS